MFRKLKKFSRISFFILKSTLKYQKRKIVILFKKIIKFKFNKLRLLVSSILLLFFLFGVGFFLILNGKIFSLFKKSNFVQDYEEEKIWEVMIVIRDQQLPDPREDQKYSLKRGDVLVFRPAEHQWSQTEYQSYLLVKIKAKRTLMEKLIEPLLDENKGEEDFKKEEEQRKGETDKIKLARRYKIDLEKIAFLEDQVINGQPFKDKIFELNEIMIDKAKIR